MIHAPSRSSREQFDRQAAHYDQQWNRWNEESLAWMIERAKPRPDEVVLDVATGAGFTALAFAPLVRSVTGLDVSTGMLDQARIKAGAAGITNVEWREGPAERLPFANQSFDLVTCRIAAHHFLDVPGFLRETVRVLRSRGRFLLADTIVPDDPEVDRWHNYLEVVRDPSHVRNYTPDEWLNMAEDAGLKVVEHNVLAGSIRLLSSDWLRKAGCNRKQSEEVNRLLDEAPDLARKAFQIERLPDGDHALAWQRIVILGEVS